MWKLCDGDLDKVDGRTCFDAAEQGDKAGQAAVEEYTNALGEAIVNAINTLQPEIICLGGGVSNRAKICSDQSAVIWIASALTALLHTAHRCASLSLAMMPASSAQL